MQLRTKLLTQAQQLYQPQRRKCKQLATHIVQDRARFKMRQHAALRQHEALNIQMRSVRHKWSLRAVQRQSMREINTNSLHGRGATRWRFLTVRSFVACFVAISWLLCCARTPAAI